MFGHRSQKSFSPLHWSKACIERSWKLRSSLINKDWEVADHDGADDPGGEQDDDVDHHVDLPDDHQNNDPLEGSDSCKIWTLGVVAMGGGSYSRGHEFKSQHQKPDGHYFTWFFVIFIVHNNFQTYFFHNNLVFNKEFIIN